MAQQQKPRQQRAGGRTGQAQAPGGRQANTNGTRVGAAATTGAPAAPTTGATRTNTRSTAAATRSAQLQKARQRRTTLLLGGGTTALLAVILLGALLLAHPWSSSSSLVDSNASALNDLSNPKLPLIATGSTAPDFSLKTTDGKSYTLSSLRGKVVMLEFFAVWCPHCQAMAPIIDGVNKQFPNAQTLSILASPYDRYHDLTGSTGTVQQSDIDYFENTFHVNNPILIDPEFTTVLKYGANSYPTIYILNKQGVVTYSSVSEVSAATLAAALKKAGA